MRASIAVLIVGGCLVHGLGTYDSVPKWGLLSLAAALSALWLLRSMWRYR